MKTVRHFFAILVMAAMVSACGYHNPNVYNGPSKTIYMTEWKNRTSELGLDSEIYRSLTKWFQKSGSIATVRTKEGADLIFAGEIISLELPSLAYGENSITTQVKVILRVRYILKDFATKKIVLEVPSETWTREFLVGDSSSSNSSNEKEALDTIIDDMSKRIYQRTITKLRTVP